jgi:hypothetical protein
MAMPSNEAPVATDGSGKLSGDRVAQAQDVVAGDLAHPPQVFVSLMTGASLGTSTGFHAPSQARARSRDMRSGHRSTSLHAGAEVPEGRGGGGLQDHAGARCRAGVSRAHAVVRWCPSRERRAVKRAQAAEISRAIQGAGRLLGPLEGGQNLQGNCPISLRFSLPRVPCLGLLYSNAHKSIRKQGGQEEVEEGGNAEGKKGGYQEA